MSDRSKRFTLAAALATAPLAASLIPSAASAAPAAGLVNCLTGAVTITYSPGVTNASGTDIALFTGVVTGGLFAGQNFVDTETFAGINPTLQCLTPPGVQRRDTLAHITTIG